MQLWFCNYRVSGNYWLIEYLAIGLNNAINRNLNWWTSILNGEKSILAV